jgi:hypothetical protein
VIVFVFGSHDHVSRARMATTVSQAGQISYKSFV